MRFASLILLVLLVSCSDNRTASPVFISTDSISDRTLQLRDSLSASINEIDSLKPEVSKAIAQLKHYEQLKQQYEKEEAVIIYKPVVDSSAIAALRVKLNNANNEISRLNNQLASIRNKPVSQPVQDALTYVQPAIITPDDNSLIISLDGSSKRGEIFIPENLTIYLIPYVKSNRAIKKLMNYDSSCPELSDIQPALYYKGLYFFNSVPNGKYLIKICTYFGNYKLIDKQTGKQSISMQISPPIQ